MQAAKASLTAEAGGSTRQLRTVSFPCQPLTSRILNGESERSGKKNDIWKRGFANEEKKIEIKIKRNLQFSQRKFEVNNLEVYEGQLSFKNTKKNART